MKKNFIKIMSLGIIGVSALTLQATKANAEWMQDAKTSYGYNVKDRRMVSNWRYSEQGKYITGWKKIDDKWYYFDSNGYMQNDGWIKSGNKYYYLTKSGNMLVNARTPDGYEVGSDGAWIKGLNYAQSVATANTSQTVANQQESNKNG